MWPLRSTASPYTAGADNHWYNGSRKRTGGNFGIRKCDATTIPPIITVA